MPTLLLLALLAAPADAAIELYDSGKYAEACAALRPLDAAGSLPGPVLYRLFFCERTGGNEAAAKQALDRAIGTLEKENVAEAPLEIPFYLANAYSNLGRSGDARKIAEAATRSVEAGTRPKPSGVIDAFQLGKLYQDQAKTEEAVRWYGQAIGAFDPASPRYAGSIRWALRYTSAVAQSKGDLAGAEAPLTTLTGLGGAEAGDFSALALVLAKQKKYEAASDAWKRAVQADPASGDDPRYASRIALVASRLAALPTVGAEGKAFATMAPQELEATMKAEAEAAREVQGRASAATSPAADGTPTATIDPKVRASLQSELDAIKGRFFAAALEYAVRRAPIRETAFREGYAVLIFQDKEWEI